MDRTRPREVFRAIDRALNDGGSAAPAAEAKAAGGGGGGGWSGASRLASYASGVRVLAAAAARVFLTPAEVTKPLNESTRPRRRRRGSTTGGGKHKKGGLGKGAKPAKKTPEKAPKKGGRRGSLDVMLGAAPTPSKLAAPDEAAARRRLAADAAGTRAHAGEGVSQDAVGVRKLDAATDHISAAKSPPPKSPPPP